MYYYCLIDFLALLVLLIINHDVLLKKEDAVDSPTQKYYRYFLYAVIAYYFTDMLWYWLYVKSWISWLYIDTEVYFIVMAAGIQLWARFAVEYLGGRNAFGKLLTYAARTLFIYVLIVTLLNRWYPLMFWFDADGVYQTGIARELMFSAQVVLLLLTVMYTLSVSSHSVDRKRQRHQTIGLSGLIMMVFVAVQIFFPTYPLYAISYMLGCCLLRTFVIENEREEYRCSLEISLKREQEQFQELKSAWKLAYTDALTGVKTKLAYVEKGEQIDRQISNGTIGELAIAVFDVNDLKIVNDTLGHDIGDAFIQKACQLISGIFKKSPVYRVGGDEFVAILEHEDYENRYSLLQAFNQQIEANRQNKSVVIAVGMVEYKPGEDKSYKRIFERADMQMYKRKRELKALAGETF